VDDWVLPALSALCERTKHINLKEARQMNIEDVVLVTTVREETRGLGPFLDTTGFKRRIEAAQVRMVAHVENDDDDSVSSESEADEWEPLHPSTKIGTSTTAKEGEDDGILEVAVAAVTASKVVDDRGDEPSVVAPEDSLITLPVKVKKKRMASKKKKSSSVACATEENLKVNMAKSEAILEKVEKANPSDPVLAKAERPIPEKGGGKGLFGQGPSNPPVTFSWLGSVNSGLVNSTTSMSQ